MNNENKSSFEFKDLSLENIMDAYIYNFMVDEEIDPEKAMIKFFSKQGCNGEESFLKKIQDAYGDNESIQALKEGFSDEMAVGVIVIEDQITNNFYSCIASFDREFLELCPTAQLTVLYRQTKSQLTRWFMENKRTK